MQNMPVSVNERHSSQIMQNLSIWPSYVHFMRCDAIFQTLWGACLAKHINNFEVNQKTTIELSPCIDGWPDSSIP